MSTKKQWAEEPLPPDCPPGDAFVPNNNVFYRLVDAFPPQESDFYSNLKRNPEKQSYRNIDECLQKSCSIFASYTACEKIKKLDHHKNKQIVKLILPPESGVVKRTFAKEHHYSWWMADDFDPIPYCLTEYE